MRFCCINVSKSKQDFHDSPAVKNVKIFSYKEIKAATNNFGRSNKLGQGGFGIVYKGQLTDGIHIAAKVLATESEQGEKEFMTEIESIADVKHNNLVMLLGCSIQRCNRVLIYEYVANNSLDRLLLGSTNGEINLTWDLRSAICKGTACGLSYLHDELEPPIVHRDIKASNILLDQNFVPKIGDFGLAKLFPNGISHISTRVVGTYGYLAPEYAVHGQLTKKADVYSFGVLLLEVTSGKRISQSYNIHDSEMFLVQRAWHLYEKQRLLDLVDPNLKDYPEEEVLRYIKVALFCTQCAANKRPFMRQVVEMLSRPIKLNEEELKHTCSIKDMIGCEAKGALSSMFVSNSAVWPPMNSSSFTHSQIIPR
ncbi:Leucine-rich repeat transmembrane protein kinase [Rhynchospora pubera]|uniref:Leucine-rich repeat transmembrane protein kinase n=1 Tax=Rhynchospora pubera TaxID=906938 RepID=A0AAV8H8B2_9POAL|nr:Leucine-rich repeat transmembrane protein kinase [Rhynchospora pubera]